MNELYQRESNKRDNFSYLGMMVIPCTQEHLWNLLITPGQLKNIHPNCKDHYGDKLTGVGSTDSIVYINGATRERTVTKWTPNKLICLDAVDPANNSLSSVEWKISENNHPSFCCLSITISTCSYQNIPRPIWPFYSRFKLQNSYKHYLKGLLTGIQTTCQNKKQTLLKNNDTTTKAKTS
jgi:hypothetical protein